MKKPKIGYKTSDLFYEGPNKLNFKVLEIKSKDSNLGFNIKKVLRVKDAIKGKDVSMHSQTSRVFSCNDLGMSKFNEAELSVIKAEIVLCNILGIKELIIHLKQDKLTKGEESRFRELLNFAKKKKVELIYESNGYFKADTCLDVLKKFPKLNYNLDLGHLNTAVVNKTLGMDLDDFLEKVKNRTVYIHAHNNNGKDKHLGLDEGSLDWEHVLDKLDHSRIRKIIIEVHNPKKVKKTEKLLKEYANKKC